MYAIIETGSKQYRVEEGDLINVELLKIDEGANHVIENVLLISKDGDTKIGTPNVSGATVETTIVNHGRDKKVIVYKFKSKKGYRKQKGHRQPFTQLKIEKING